ncbi:hypothetical protein BDEG_23435 [Batrachochytrium dendrobatidis JEL423]|uniref:non-specific serine/threonine protein kinase n=1 Tax=Batrachochytrium dendrobatidis (strain JEL423) TaxID=403673 RepID=A0A177WIW2_BATDL|nr:hypothetical protein BDEG_23435 [Batrachochytrium dendrobatidis JEL423]
MSDLLGDLPPKGNRISSAAAVSTIQSRPATSNAIRGNSTAPVSEPSTAASAQYKSKHVGNYKLLETIGEGSFAKVKLAIHRLTRQKVAVKIIDKARLPDEYSLKNIHREAQIMRMIDHPNVIQLFEVMETKKNLFLVLEYATGDFGLSNIFNPESVLGTSCGSPVYSAPELIEGKKYVGPEVDAWSLGINVYAMVVGDLPFADANLTALYESILRGKYQIPDFVSSDCKDFIAKLLVLNPKKRATISQMQDHSWLNDGTSFLEPTSSLPQGGFRPKTEDQLDPFILEQLEQMGFERKAAAQAVLSGKFNQPAGTYYLLAYARRKNCNIAVGQQQSGANCSIQGIGDTYKELDDEFGDQQRMKIQSNGDVTSDELARILFQVEGIRGAAELSTKDGNRHTFKDMHITDRRSRQPSANQYSSNIPSSNVVKASVDTKLNKPVIRRARAKGVTVNPTSGVSTKQTSNTTSSSIHMSTLPCKNSSEFLDMRSIDTQSLLPRIVQNLTNRAFQSKVVNLPNINSPSFNSKNNSFTHLNDVSPLLKHSANPQFDLSGHSQAASAKPPVSRQMPKNTHIAIDESMYISKDQENDTGDQPCSSSMGAPRTIRFAFNCTATTMVQPDILFNRLKSTFEQNDIDWRHDGYLCDCEWGDIKFEVEVCKLPRVCSYGIRLKRISGDIWEYKKLCSKITNDLESLQ